jgi:L-fuculose-phosphate aldolase
MDETGLRTELIGVCRKLLAGGLIAASDGNVSCRVGDDRLIITPGGAHKGELRPIDLILVNLRGEVLAGQGKPSSEVRMHLLVYEKRPEVQALVHAHPPMLTAFTLAGLPFMAEALPEVWLTIGPVPMAPYATPCTQEVPESIAPFIERNDAVVLERHGSLTLGSSLREAYMRTEKLEHAAHTLFYAHLLKQSPVSPLQRKSLEKLEELKVGRRG